MTSSQAASSKAGIALGALLLLTALPAQPRAHDPISTKVTFAREIRAILAARCVTCHSARGSAPMPLTTYDEVRPWARSIKEQVLTRRMPKWHAARGYGAFANDPTLTPLESALIVSWVDGGLPMGAPSAPASPGDPAAFAASSDRLLTIRPSGGAAAVQIPVTSVSGWTFEAGDPLITSATISSSAGAIGTWVAGDGPTVLPSGSAIRASGQLRVDLRRRRSTDYEQPFTPRRSVLRLKVTAEEAVRRVRLEQVACGAVTSRPGTVLAVRPLLHAGASARLWLQRPGATAGIVGWFRDFDPIFARTYWLARPLDLTIDSRLQSDAKCMLELTLASAR